MNTRPAPRIGFVDLGSLIYLGAVWGAAFLFFRVASPEVGPIWITQHVGAAARLRAQLASDQPHHVARRPMEKGRVSDR